MAKIQMATFQKIGKRWRARVRRKGFPARSEMFDTKAQAQDRASRQEANMRALTFQDVRIIADKALGAAIHRHMEEQTQVKPLGKNKKAVLPTLKPHLGKLMTPELTGGVLIDYVKDRRTAGAPDRTRHAYPAWPARRLAGHGTGATCRESCAEWITAVSATI